MNNTLQAENQQLRYQLTCLLDEARLNEKKLQRLDQLERRMIATSSLPELIQVVLRDYKIACDIDVVTLVLIDPEYEITRLLQSVSPHNEEYIGLVLLEKLHNDIDRPYVGVFDTEVNGAIFDPWLDDCKSMALLPLMRNHEFIGSLNLGSCHGNRFSADSGTEFLQRLAAILSICLENALNHERLKLTGLTDPLTGINNRRYFDSRCREEIAYATRHKQPLACMFLDIDKFKHINDSLGHAAGDEVLRRVAAIIKSQLRGNDVIARYGGEEFVALLPQTAQDKALEIAERIRTTIGFEPFEPLPDESLAVTISIGVAMLADQAGGNEDALAQSLISRADAALYQAKEGGRNRVVCAS